MVEGIIGAQGQRLLDLGLGLAQPFLLLTPERRDARFQGVDLPLERLLLAGGASLLHVLLQVVQFGHQRPLGLLGRSRDPIIELGQIAAEKGGSDAVKDFGNQMVKDHGKINDNLKELAGKMNVTLPATVSAKHKAAIEKMSGMSGANFDNAYVPAMVKDHKMDIAEFEKAGKMVKNEDLKKFINDSLETMKDHLEKIEKFDQAKPKS